MNMRMHEQLFSGISARNFDNIAIENVCKPVSSAANESFTDSKNYHSKSSEGILRGLEKRIAVKLSDDKVSFNMFSQY